MIREAYKIVHISTYPKGGAGRAAYRIHKALLKNGMDSHFICLDEKPGDRYVSRPSPCEKKTEKISLFNVLKDKIKWRLKRHFNIIIISEKETITKNFKILFPKLNCEIAKLPFSDYDLLADHFVQNADIIHLHWVANLLDYPSFFKNVNKPVVWTLHDMNPFQGMFHYKEDEEKNNAVASSLDKKVKTIKRKSIRNINVKLSIVTPSHWLLDAAVRSKVFKNVKGYHIPYPLDMEIFSPVPNGSFRDALNIPKDHIIFLFVAQSTGNHRKGFDLLLEALKKINQENISLLVIGNSDNWQVNGLNVILLGSIEDERTLSKYYSMADAFILPSLEDNLPNVMLEAMACGTPVISFDVGGMSEIIKNGFNGMKAKSMNFMGLANVLTEFINSKENYNRERIRNYALENFSEKIIAEKYKVVY
ncbi:MAG TPA: glycosyltransferase, partial [Hanamia sp.]|nr:glycosyltransferase [Hanamia sp.]